MHTAKYFYCFTVANTEKSHLGKRTLAQSGRALALGARRRRSKSCMSDIVL